jgi:hypothetical protein
MKAKFLAFCDYASISKENKLSVMGIFDQVLVAKFPGGLSRAFFVATVEGEQNKKFNLSLHGKLGEKTIFPQIKIEGLTSENGKHNILLDLNGMMFPEEGVFEFYLTEGNKTIGSTELNVSSGKSYEITKLPN